MKKLIKIMILSFFALTILISPSCNFLDVQDHYDEQIPYDSVFANTRNLQRYLWSIPTAFPDDGELLAYSYTPGPLATDEGITAFANVSTWKGIAFSTGVVTPTEMHNLDYWGPRYQLIRRVNILLSRMDEASDLTPSDRREIVGYARFMRAFAYYHLLMNYGPVVLLGDEVLKNNEDESYYDRARATYDECIEYICEEFEEAAKNMPATVLNTQFGRPSRGSAWGLITRLRLQHASPLYNGGDIAKRYFGAWTRSTDGVHYISQNYDERRWAVAAAAAKRMIEHSTYSLHIVPADAETPQFPATIPTEDFPNGIGGIDPFKSYSNMFTGETIGSKNTEYVWGRRSAAIADRTRNSFPRPLMNGYNGISIPQKIIDNYRMIDGKDINQASPEYPYRADIMNPGDGKKFSGYELPKNISGMYVDREMRFYASVGFSGRLWVGASTTEAAAKNLIITYDYAGNSGIGQTENAYDYPPTGYVITKYIHEDDNWRGEGAIRMEKSFPIIRYAEILLAYVEAMNNLTQSYTITLATSPTADEDFDISRNIEDMRFNFNQVRFRAGLPGLSDSELADPIVMQELMEREMMIEFLHENRRYFDTRRWGIYEREESKPVMGMNVYATGLSFFVPTRVSHKYARERIAHPRLMFLPISEAEMNRARSLDQNPGY